MPCVALFSVSDGLALAVNSSLAYCAVQGPTRAGPAIVLLAERLHETLAPVLFTGPSHIIATFPGSELVGCSYKHPLRPDGSVSRDAVPDRAGRRCPSSLRTMSQRKQVPSSTFFILSLTYHSRLCRQQLAAAPPSDPQAPASCTRPRRTGSTTMRRACAMASNQSTILSTRPAATPRRLGPHWRGRRWDAPLDIL